MTTPEVLLLHGVLVNALEMLYLKSQLEKHGFKVHTLSYQSVTQTIDENTHSLYHKITALDCSALHVVAHSLGGIMTMHLLEKYPDLPIKRVVMLGTPINGSLIAKKVCRWKLIGSLLTNSMKNGLAGDHRYPPSAPCEIGMIAGDIEVPMGFGMVLGKLPGPSDGTVLLSETKHPLISQHQVVKKSHTGLVFSPMVGKLVANFLRNGVFSG